MSDVRQSAWWSRALADPREARGIFVADDEDMGVVGFGSCGPVREIPEGLDGTEQRVGEVYTLYVEGDFQNQGLGRRLLDAMFRQLQADGCDTAILWMLADNPARFFYEGLGGDPVGRRADRMAGTEVEEVAYAWRDLDAPLVRRKLAPEARGLGVHGVNASPLGRGPVRCRWHRHFRPGVPRIHRSRAPKKHPGREAAGRPGAVNGIGRTAGIIMPATLHQAASEHLLRAMARRFPSNARREGGANAQGGLSAKRRYPQVLAARGATELRGGGASSPSSHDATHWQLRASPPARKTSHIAAPTRAAYIGP